MSAWTIHARQGNSRRRQFMRRKVQFIFHFVILSESERSFGLCLRMTRDWLSMPVPQSRCLTGRRGRRPLRSVAVILPSLCNGAANRALPVAATIPQSPIGDSPLYTRGPRREVSCDRNKEPKGVNNDARRLYFGIGAECNEAGGLSIPVPLSRSLAGRRGRRPLRITSRSLALPV